MKKRTNYKINYKYRGQTVIELAVFGAVLIFVIGMIVRSSLSKNQVQHHSLKALRTALKTSFEYSEAIKGQYTSLGSPDGNASRNQASIIFIEDRLTADSGKYGAVDRTPLMMGSSGTHSRNLFLPVDANETWNLPRMDIFVNGIHFPFMMAGLKVVDLTYDHDNDESLSPPPPIPTPRIPKPLFVMIPSHPEIADWDPGCVAVGTCFDLDRSGVIDADEPSSATDRANFAWQWKQITYGSIDLEQGKYTTVDVDYDLSGGDTEEEKVLSIDLNGMAQVLDYQEGDVNFSTIPPPGFDQDIQMYTITRPGTYLEIKEGKLYSADPTRQFISTASKKDSVDIIQRVFRLSNNTERFCDLNGNLMGPLLEDGPQPAGLPNPVEACNNCFSPANIEKTCMDTTNNIIMIRSRVKDLHGRKYVTDVQGDPYIAF